MISTLSTILDDEELGKIIEIQSGMCVFNYFIDFRACPPFSASPHDHAHIPTPSNHRMETLRETNGNISTFNDFSESKYKEYAKIMKHYTEMVVGMKSDLDYIFMTIR